MAGLEHALELGIKAIDIYMDSQLVVRQVAGIYKVKNEQLKPWHTRVLALKSHFTTWRLNHVLRQYITARLTRSPTAGLISNLVQWKCQITSQSPVF